MQRLIASRQRIGGGFHQMSPILNLGAPNKRLTSTTQAGSAAAVNSEIVSI